MFEPAVAVRDFLRMKSTERRKTIFLFACNSNIEVSRDLPDVAFTHRSLSPGSSLPDRIYGAGRLIFLVSVTSLPFDAYYSNNRNRFCSPIAVLYKI